MRTKVRCVMAVSGGIRLASYCIADKYGRPVLVQTPCRDSAQYIPPKVLRIAAINRPFANNRPDSIPTSRSVRARLP